MGAVSRPAMMPRSGKSTNGISAVANRGIASVIHQTAISAATAASRLAAGLVGSTGNASSNANAAIPSQKPKTRALSLVVRSVMGSSGIGVPFRLKWCGDDQEGAFAGS